MMMKRAVLVTVIGLGLLAACAPTATTRGEINMNRQEEINMNHQEWIAIHMKPLEELDLDYLLSEEGLKCYFPGVYRSAAIEDASRRLPEIKGALKTIEEAQARLKALLSGPKDTDTLREFRYLQDLLSDEEVGPQGKPKVKLDLVERVEILENGRAARYRIEWDLNGKTETTSLYLRYTALPSGWRPCLVEADAIMIPPHVAVAIYIKRLRKVASFWNRPLDEVMKAYYNKLMGR